MAIHAVGIEEHLIAPRRHRDDQSTTTSREAPRAADGNDITPRVQSVAIAAEARVLHRGERDDDVEPHSAGTCQHARLQRCRRESAQTRVADLDLAILERRDVCGARSESARRWRTYKVVTRDTFQLDKSPLKELAW